MGEGSISFGGESVNRTVMQDVMGCATTLGEIIEYYQRDDILSILYHQTVNWKAEMRFRGKFTVLRPSDPEELCRTILEFISQLTPGVRSDEKLSEYPTFDVKYDRGDLVEQRYDWITEDDPESWEIAFERMKPVLDVLDTFGVYYQIQFSGHRSLHLRIPAEAFPKRFQGKPVADFQIVQRDESGHRSIYNRLHWAINRYLPPSGHSPFSLRMTYTTHPMTGLVALPLRRNELEIFHPLMASIHMIEVDQSWFSVPKGAPKRMSGFLHEALRNSGKRKHQAWKERRSLIKPQPSADTVKLTLGERREKAE
jgi:hypothetical protein